MGKLTAPAPIDTVHSADNFDCGISSLDHWLQRQALKNEASGASRTFVVCVGNEVVGYYALATGSILRRQAPGKIKREMPEPIPVMVLGRLAVDRKWQDLASAAVCCETRCFEPIMFLNRWVFVLYWFTHCRKRQKHFTFTTVS